MNVYFVSGLGADRRAFERIRLPAMYTIHYIDWIPPLKNESLNAYAGRLTKAIDTTRPFALVGLSFGGMIATTMNQYVQPQKTILISSIGCWKELPPYFQWAGLLHFDKLLPMYVLNRPTIVAQWLFGAKKAVEKKALDQIIADADPHFIKWAIGAILRWKDKERPDYLFHIHGDKDKILPHYYTKPNVIIKNGSHFMVWTHASTVSKALEQALAPSISPKGEGSRHKA